MSEVYWSVLPDAAIMPNPFIHIVQVAERAGQLGYHYIPSIRQRTDIARDYICSEFKKLTQNPDDILVQLDCDHDHPTNIIEGLVANDKPVCAAYAVRRNPSNPHPCMWIRDENGILRVPRVVEKKLIKVDITGTGAIAIKRNVFTALDEAGFDLGYWKYQYYPDGTSGSEEVFFNQICASLNIPIFVDGRIETPHWTEAELNGSSWEQYIVDHPIVKREHKVSVIIPQKGRLDKLKVALDSLVATAPEVECIVLVDSGDSESGDFLSSVYPMSKNIIWYFVSNKRPIDKWNHGMMLATGDVMVVAANDVEFGDKWLGYALDALDSVPDGNAMVAFNDTITTPEVSSPHFLMSREYIIKYNGGVLMPPVYKKQFPDVENRLRAQSLGRYVCAKASIVKHLHPLTNTAPWDEIYREGLDTFDEDQKLCAERQKQEFPIVWQPMLK